MPSLVATLRAQPATGCAPLRDLSARLLTNPAVACAPGQHLVTLPQVGTVLVDETRTTLRIHVTTDGEDAAARACAALLRLVADVSPAVVVSWARADEGVRV